MATMTDPSPELIEAMRQAIHDVGPIRYEGWYSDRCAQVAQDALDAQALRSERGFDDMRAAWAAEQARYAELVEAFPDDNPNHLTAVTFHPPDICGIDGLRLTITNHTGDTP